MASNARVKAVLFDLDGTLADTSPDMSAALNRLLVKYGRPEVDHAHARNHTSQGSIALIKLGFEEPIKEQQMHILRDEFLKLYADNLCRQTTLFPGVSEVLQSLDTTVMPWGIVTNKPGNLAEPLLQELGIAANAACIVSGDTLARRKPDPDQLHHAANILDIEEHNILYMGDDPRDIQAGKAAGMKTAVAAYGYIQDSEDLLSWDADIVFDQALDLKDWLFNNS